ncbi:hypothetical protein KKA93_01395 [Patescibacteria group bacterium]|nr:hypothetical protein [Patescibacteria group bacterium]MBU1663118.1 hypothetical protein [Patescibacteria group bacterium]MBU1933705.1 hypothetical protein [Patescibacteria group bacterium]MBU2008017.1 hypothetical protein [Patescibacteria group bacterium]MBU2233702.1 hypothetical protein [Patescibacteria group bacterium]
MAQKLGEWGLRKKFSIDKLSRVGSVYFKKNVPEPGVQRGSVLKNTLIGLGKGKMTEYQFEKALKLSGVTGSQLGKRKKILGLVYGHGNSNLEKKQTDSKIKEKNLNRIRQERRNEFRVISAGAINSQQYAGGKEVGSRGVMERGIMGDLGVSRSKKAGDKIGGFASQYNDSKLPNNSAPKMPSVSIKQPGL